MKPFLPIFFVLFSLTAFGQTFEYGSGVQLYRFKGNLYTPYFNRGLPVNSTKLNFTALFGGNIPVKKLKEKLVLGISPNLSFGAFYDMLTADVPVYVTLKTGVTSTKEDPSMFGGGVGLGVQVSALSTNLIADDHTNFIDYSGVFISPTLMGEFSADFNSVIYKLRIDIAPIDLKPLTRKSDKAPFFNAENINQFNVRIMKTFL